MAFGLFRKKEAFADKVFHNAHIYTMDSGLPWAEAVAVKDGKVLTVGNFEEMQAIINEETEVIDLNGKYMVPGFIDIHHSPVMKMMGEEIEDEPEEQEEEEAETRNIFASLDHAAVYEYAEDGEIDEWGAEEDDSEEESGEEPALEDAGTTGEEGDSDEAEEYEGPDESDEFDDETEYFIDNSEFTEKAAETLEALSDHGFTTVLDLRTPNNVENEFTDSLIELYTEGKLNQRFFGALYINQPVPGRLVKEVLNMRRTKCTEVGDMIKNEFLYVLLDSGEDRIFPQDALDSILEECADRGFSFYIEAVTKEDLLKAYNAVDYVRNRGHKNCIIIASDEELTDEEDAELSASATVYLTWRSDVMGRSFFEGNITDIEEAIEHLTLESAEMLGMENKLGSIERGKYADFAVFSENPLEARPGQLSKLYCDMTVVDGEIVHDVDAENDEYMMNMIMYSR